MILGRGVSGNLPIIERPFKGNRKRDNETICSLDLEISKVDQRMIWKIYLYKDSMEEGVG